MPISKILALIALLMMLNLPIPILLLQQFPPRDLVIIVPLCFLLIAFPSKARLVMAFSIA
jgi:hypothetical protein